MADSTSTTGGGLHFDATINESGFNASINKMNTGINELTNNTVAQGQKVEDFAKKVSDSNAGILERLKTKLAEFKASADSAMSVSAIEKYNAKIQEFEAEITRLTNIGKAGFDDLGNAIKTSYERPVGTLNRLVELQKIYQIGAASMTNPDLIAKYNQKLEETTAAIARTKNIGKAGFDDLGNAIKKTIGYQETLTNRLKIYNDAVKAQPNTAQGAQNIVALNKKIEETQTELQRLNNAGKKGFDEFGNSVQKAGGFLSGLKDQIVGMVASYLTLYAGIAAIKSIIHSNAELSDSISDVKRTTKETSEEVANLVTTLKGVDTRTSLDGLLETGFIGGQLAVAKKDLVGYIETIDQLAVVLKREFPGGAEVVARSLGKIISIYKLTSKENISLEEALRKVGSAFLGIAHSGPINVQYLQDFTLRTAGAAQVAKLSLPTMLAYGAVLSEAGVSAQIAASSTTRLVSSLSGKREKYFAIAQLADSTLTLEKFTKLINTDSKTALDLFFKGLKSGNPTTTEFNDRLGTLGFKVGAATNAITALALNQEKLSDKIKIGNEQYGDAAALAENFAEKNNNLAASLDKVGNAFTNISSNPDSAIGKTFKWFIDATVIFIKNLDTALDRLGQIGSGLKTAFGDIFSGPAAAAKRQADAMAEINEQKRQSIILANRDAVEGRATIKAKVILENTTDETSLKKAIAIEQQKLQRLYDQSNYAKEFAKNPKNSSDDIKPFIDKFKKLQAPLLQQQTIVDKLKKSYDGLYGAVQETYDYGSGDSRTIDDIKADIKSVQALMKPLDVNSKQFAEYAAKLKDLRKELKIANGGVDKSSETAANQYAAALKAKTDLQIKIDELTKKGTDKQLTADEQEIASVKDKYAKMRAEAVAFNNDPKNKAKGLSVSTSGLAGAQKNELASVIYKQDTAKLNIELDKQKDLYAQYEQFKTDFGEAAAKKRFEDDINLQANYLQKLESERDKILNIAPSQRTGAQSDRLIGLNTRINDEVKSQKAVYASMLVELRGYQEKATALEDNYAKKKKSIQEDSNLTPDQKAYNIKLLAEQYQADTDAVKDSVFQKSEAYRHLTEQVAMYTKEQLQSQVEAIDYTLKNATGITPKLHELLAKELSDVKVRLSFGGGDKAFEDDLKKKKAEIEQVLSCGVKIDDKGELTTVKLTTAEYEEQVKTLAEINNQLKLTTSAKFTDLANKLQIISGAFTDISGAIGDLNPSLADTFQVLGDIAGAGAEASKAVASFSTGDIVGGIGSAVKSLTGLFKVFTSGKASAKAAAIELQGHQDDLFKSEIAYNELLRERARTLKDIGALSIAELNTQKELLKTQVSQAQSDYSKLLAKIQASGQQITGYHNEKYGGILGIGKKTRTVAETAGLAGVDYDTLEKLFTEGKLDDATKAWFTELQKAKEELDAIGVSTDDVIAAINQAATGTTAASIADAIISGFKQGKKTAEDFADDFQGLMEDAALSAFKSNYLNAAIADFYKQFAAASADGLSDEDVKTLRDAYSKIIQDSADQLAGFDKVIGGIGKTTTKTGVSGAVVAEALTEGTANRVLGISIAELDEIKRQGIVNQGYQKLALNNLSEIAANTLRTADNTELLKPMADKLDKIIENTGGSDSTDLYQALRDGGVKNV